MKTFKTKEERSNFLLESNDNLNNIGKLKNSITSETKQSHCNDFVKIYLVKKNNKIQDIKFETNSCIITNVSTDLFLSIIKGKTISEGSKLLSLYKNYIENNVYNEELKNINVFENLIKNNRRISCLLVVYEVVNKLIN